MKRLDCQHIKRGKQQSRSHHFPRERRYTKGILLNIYQRTGNMSKRKMGECATRHHFPKEVNTYAKCIQGKQNMSNRKRGTVHASLFPRKED
jgi:hypothetical protein